MNGGGRDDRQKTALCADMPLEEQIMLCSGADAWHTKAMPDAGLGALCMSDGPHGLRRPRGGSELAVLSDAEPATCFPTAALTGCSWDPALLEQIGAAIGKEAADKGVGLLLGPGANIKRSPLCGRNFEYFSEDPLLSGKLAAGYIRGVEQTGVGACLKHFAANNQEYMRLCSDSVMDERTLREIYLRSFEIAVREGKPSAVMCAYNKLNGEYCSDSRRLLTGVLRDEWGFDGMVVSDWGAMHDRRAAFAAGCDLNMPGGSAYQEKEAAEAVRQGRLDRACVERSAERVARLALRAQQVQKSGAAFDARAHHELAKRAACESAVLLKNDKGLLPLSEETDLLLVGPAVWKLREQGAGSSHVTPHSMPQLAEILADVPAEAGCLGDGSRDAKLLKAAVKAAKKAGAAVVIAALPDACESEGFDRETMALPEGVNELVESVAAVNAHTAVVLLCGSPVELPWADKVKAILYMGLPGEAGAEAIVELLFGRACPGGRLAESWPLRGGDCVCAPYYGAGRKDAHYREGVYVGYRYYQKAQVPVRFPFGHGLSYTSFSLSELKLAGDTVSCRIKNTGRSDGFAVLQLYVEPPAGESYRPARELRAFQKVFLRRGESAALSFELDERCFAVWADGWVVPGGRYRVLLGWSSEELPLSAEIDREGPALGEESLPAWYLHPAPGPRHMDFERLLGRPAVESRPVKGAFTMDNSLGEILGDTLWKKLAAIAIRKYLDQSVGADRNSADYRAAYAMATELPLRAMQSFTGLDSRLTQALLDLANGRGAAALRALLGRSG